MADAELAGVRVFGAPRAHGVAQQVASVARGGEEGLVRLGSTVPALHRDAVRNNSSRARGADILTASLDNR